MAFEAHVKVSNSTSRLGQNTCEKGILEKENGIKAQRYSMKHMFRQHSRCYIPNIGNLGWAQKGLEAF